MTTIVIKDLQDNVELDRAAMVAIIGGARSGGGSALRARTISSVSRIVTYPAGYVSNPLADAGRQTIESKSRK